MNWKVIYFFFIVLFFGLFAGFNMENTCNVSFIFYSFKNIPIYVTALFSFLVGVILSIPFLFGNKRKVKPNKERNTFSNPMTDDIRGENIKKTKRKFFNRNHENSTASFSDDVKS